MIEMTDTTESTTIDVFWQLAKAGDQREDPRVEFRHTHGNSVNLAFDLHHCVLASVECDNLVDRRVLKDD